MRRGKEKRMTPCFGGALKGVLHLFPHCNELNHPVVLPVAWILQEVHIIFVVIQYDNLRFLLGGSPFFNLLGEVYDGFLGAFFLWSLREVGRGTRSAFGGRSKTKRRNWRHEWMGIMKWHVIFHSSITLEIWWGWNCRTLCTKCFGWGMRTCTSPWSLFGRGALGLHWNHELGCKKLKISGNMMTLKHQWKKKPTKPKKSLTKKKTKNKKQTKTKTKRPQGLGRTWSHEGRGGKRGRVGWGVRQWRGSEPADGDSPAEATARTTEWGLALLGKQAGLQGQRAQKGGPLGLPGRSSRPWPL